MHLIFYIYVKGKRKLKFESAIALDEYIKTVKMPPDAKLIIFKDNINAGEMLIKKYLSLINKLENVN